MDARGGAGVKMVMGSSNNRRRRAPSSIALPYSLIVFSPLASWASEIGGSSFSENVRLWIFFRAILSIPGKIEIVHVIANVQLVWKISVGKFLLATFTLVKVEKELGYFGGPLISKHLRILLIPSFSTKIIDRSALISLVVSADDGWRDG